MGGAAKETGTHGGAAAVPGGDAPPFRCAEQVLLRAPVLARGRAAVTWGAPAGAAARDPAALLGYLRRLAAEPVLVEAVALASPSLSDRWRRALAGEPPSVRNLARMAVSLTRYVLRAAHRPTPFGVLAGVGLASFGTAGDPGRARLGAGHRRAVRPDWAWLAAAVARWEQDAAVLPELKVVANTLCEVRGERLVVPFTARPPHPGADEAGAGADEGCRRTTLRRTPAVEAAMREAAYPVTAGELARRLLAAFPGAPAGSVSALIRQLVGAEALLTELRPPLDGTDPLAHLLRVLPGTAAGPRRQVAELRRAAADYAVRPLGGGEPVATVAGRPVRLQADLELDADVVLPRAVAAEAERAAELLRRLSPPGPGPLAGYHRRFVERYGTERLVPLAELLDPGTGLGPPPGYRMPPGPADLAEPEAAAAAGPRGGGAEAEAALLAAYCQAVAEGRREIALDDALLGRLGAGDAAPGPEGAVELYAQVVADSVAAMAAGDFTLLLADHTSPLAGASTGRFGHLFADRARELARESAAAAAGPGALAVRVAHPVAQQRFAHVAQVPRWLDRDLLAGVYGDPSSDRAVALADVEIGADRHGFRVVSRSTGRRLVPLAFHHLNRQAGMPNAVRFLLEAPHVRLPRWRPWDWGPLARAPFLPAVRRGRTVLSAARWRLSGPALAGDRQPVAWDAEFDRFRSRWAVPDDVELVASDQCVPLHLPAPAHRELLRAELRAHGEALLREPAYGGDLGRGWLRDADGGAHSAEVVIALLPVRPAPSPDAAGAPPRTAAASPIAAALPPPRGRASAAHAPGGRWLYARLPCPQDRQDHVLTAHLAPLLRRLPAGVDRWFFVRYRDTGHHLRLRFHGDRDALYGGVLPELHALAGRLDEQGLTGGLSLATYEPETERYGGPAALPLAERVFRADSEAVLRALAAQDGGGTDPLLDAAAETAAMARAFLPPDPDTWTRWLLAAYPVRHEHRAAFTARRRAALDRITAEQDGGCPPELLEVLAEYGRSVRKAAEDASWLDPGRVLVSLLHMHGNRRLGVDPRAECGVQAIVRGAVQAHRDRARARALVLR